MRKGNKWKPLKVLVASVICQWLLIGGTKAQTTSTVEQSLTSSMTPTDSTSITMSITPTTSLETVTLSNSASTANVTATASMSNSTSVVAVAESTSSTANVTATASMSNSTSVVAVAGSTSSTANVTATASMSNSTSVVAVAESTSSTANVTAAATASMSNSTSVVAVAGSTSSTANVTATATASMSSSTSVVVVAQSVSSTAIVTPTAAASISSSTSVVAVAQSTSSNANVTATASMSSSTSVVVVAQSVSSTASVTPTAAASMSSSTSVVAVAGSTSSTANVTAAATASMSSSTSVVVVAQSVSSTANVTPTAAASMSSSTSVVAVAGSTSSTANVTAAATASMSNSTSVVAVAGSTSSTANVTAAATASMASSTSVVAVAESTSSTGSVTPTASSSGLTTPVAVVQSLSLVQTVSPSELASVTSSSQSVTVSSSVSTGLNCDKDIVIDDGAKLSEAKSGFLQGCNYAVSSQCTEASSIQSKQKSGGFSQANALSAANALVVDGETAIKVQLVKDHGACRLQLRQVTGKAVGSFVNATDNKVSGNLVIVKSPAIPPGTPYFSRTVAAVSLNESSSKCVNLSDYYTYQTIQNVSSAISSADFAFIDQATQTQYNDSVRRRNTCQLGRITVLAVDSSRGEWTLNPAINVASSSDNLACFTPEAHYSGSAVLRYRPCIVCDGTCYPGEEVTLTFNIIAVNDRPMITQAVAYVPPIKENDLANPFMVANFTSGAANGGNTSSMVVTNVVDLDNTPSGIAVVNTQGGNNLGFWEYQYEGTSDWIRLTVTNMPPYGQPNSCVQPHLLKANDKIRFNSTASSWSQCDLPQASFVYFAWDMSDGQNHGVFNVCLNAEGIPGEAYSKSVGIAIQLKEDCRSVPGGDAVRDACGVCGGDNTTCCNSNSTLKTDECGGCSVSGTPTLDCNGRCSLYVSNGTTCNICQQISNIMNYKDCNGDCFGNATMSTCSVCVGGNTGKTLNHGKDACGVCSGNNVSCTDCENVVNGGKQRDICGACLLPGDNRFNNGCTNLTTLSPTAAITESGTRILVSGAGLSSAVVSDCYFESGSNRYNAANVTKQILNGSAKALSLSTPMLPAGEYTVRCLLSADANSSAMNYTSTNTLTVYNYSAITFSSINPSEVPITTATSVYLNGINFVNTSHIRCLSKDGGISIVGQYVNSSTVRCDILAATFLSSMTVDLVLSFSASDLPYNKSRPLSVYAPGTNVQSTVFSCQFIRIKLTLPSEMASVSSNCASYFTGNISALGSSPTCELITNVHFVVSLSSDATIKPGDELSFNLNALKRKEQRVTRNMPSSVNLTVAEPSGGIPAVAVLTGPASVGPCGVLNFRADQSYASCGRAMTFSWNASWHSSVNTSVLTSAQTSAWNSTKDYLSGLSSTSSSAAVPFQQNLIGLKFTVTVSVMFFNGKSSSASLDTMWTNNTIPTLYATSPARVQVRAMHDFYLTAQVSALSCRNTMVFERFSLFYQWCVNPTAASVLNGRSRILYIPPGHLRGGTTYTTRVLAAHTAYPGMVTETSRQLEVIQSDLTVVIEGGSTQVVKQGRNYSAKACNCMDPDRLSGDFKFYWDILTDDGKPVIHMNNMGTRSAVQLESKSIVYIDTAQLLEANKSYRLKVTCKKGSRSATAETILQIGTGGLPTIELSPPAMKMLNPSAGLMIEAHVIHMSNVSFEWEAETEDTYTALNLSSTEIVEGRSTGTGILLQGDSQVVVDATLLVKENALKEGTMYKLTLKATCIKSGATSRSSFTFTTREGIRQGTLTVSPASGNALSTKFALTASGFSAGLNGDQLRYHFACTDGTGPSLIPLGVPEFSPFVDERVIGPGSSNSRKCSVKVMDQYGASASAEVMVTVTKSAINDADVRNESQAIRNAFDNGDHFSAVGLADALFSSTSSCGAPVENNLWNAQMMTVESITQAFKLGAYPGQLSRLAVVGLRKATPCAVRFDKGFIKSVASTVAEMADQRRNGMIQNNPLGEETAHDFIEIFENLYSPDDFTPRVLDASTSIRNGLTSVLRRVAMTPALRTKSISIRSKNIDSQVKHVLISSLRSSMQFTPAQHNIFKPITVNFKNAYQHLFPEWQCSSCQSCPGVTVVVSQMTIDVFSKAKLTNRVSNFVSLMVVNPTTGVDVAPMSMPNISVVIEAQQNISGMHQCNQWDGQNGTWRSDGITTESSGSFVTCTVQTPGIFVVLDVPLPSTVTPSTAANTATPALTGSVSVSTQMPGTAVTVSATTTLTTSVTSQTPLTQKAEFIGSYRCAACTCTQQDLSNSSFQQKHQNAGKDSLIRSGVPGNRIGTFTIGCGSVVYTFTILSPASGSDTITSQQLINLIETAVKNGTLTVIVDGQTFAIAKDSFSYSVVQTTPTPATKDGLSDGAIAGIVIGSIVAFLIIVALVYYFFIRKTGKMNVTIEPNDNLLEMRSKNGKVNGGYTSSP